MKWLELAAREPSQRRHESMDFVLAMTLRRTLRVSSVPSVVVRIESISNPHLVQGAKYVRAYARTLAASSAR